MALQFRNTVFGQLVRLVSGNKAMRYPDERDSSLWKKACQQNSSRQTSRPSHDSDKDTEGDVTDEQKTNDGKDVTSDVLVVGWYGPDDPEVGLQLICRLILRPLT